MNDRSLLPIVDASRLVRPMDSSGAHDSYLRLPFTLPVQVLTELVARLHRAWTELQRHGPATTTSSDQSSSVRFDVSSYVVAALLPKHH